jgi:hypothetical protein
MVMLAGTARHLIKEAPNAAAEYMRAAVKEIDSQFGKGYAANNPILVAAFMQAAAADMHAATVGYVFGEINDFIADVGNDVRSIANAIIKTSDH